MSDSKNIEHDKLVSAAQQQNIFKFRERHSQSASYIDAQLCTEMAMICIIFTQILSLLRTEVGLYSCISRSLIPFRSMIYRRHKEITPPPPPPHLIIKTQRYMDRYITFSRMFDRIFKIPEIS